MANIKISDLTAASAAADANEFEINEAGTSKKVTGSQIKAYVNAGDGALAAKDTVATADIDNLAVTTAKLADSSVTSAKIANGTIVGADIATDTITATNIAANAVGASELNVTGNGTSGQYLASDGDGTMTWTTLAVAAGGFSNLQTFNNSGTWTNPGNVTKVKVTVVGGGGNGAPSPANSNTSGGGGGGAAIEVISLPSNTNVSVTVGGAAGTSSFGGYCSASGGQNGSGNLIRSGGNGSGGNINISGTEPMAGGGGGSIFGGMGGPQDFNVNPGRPGKAYGTAGGGVRYGGRTGGAGKPGVVIVEY